MCKGFIVIFFLLIAISPVHASLVNMGNGVIFDNVNYQYWEYQMTGGTYAEQMEHVGSMSYNVDQQSQWRMAATADMAKLLTNSYADIAATFQRTDSTGTAYIWAGRYDEEVSGMEGVHQYFALKAQYYDPNGSMFDPRYCERYGIECTVEYTTKSGYLWDDTSSAPPIGGAGRIGAWIVSDAMPVPEPSTYLLVLLGLLFPLTHRSRLRHYLGF